MRCSWPISPSEAPKRNDGRHHTRPVHAHATCESAPPPTTIRTRGALLPGVVIPSLVLLAAARRYRTAAQKLHRARGDASMFERAPSAEAHAPLRAKAEPHGSPWSETRIPEGNPRCGIRGGTASAAAAAQAGSLPPFRQLLLGGSDAPPPPASAKPPEGPQPPAQNCDPKC